MSLSDGSFVVGYQTGSAMDLSGTVGMWSYTRRAPRKLEAQGSPVRRIRHR